MNKSRLQEHNKKSILEFEASLKDSLGRYLPTVREMTYEDQGHYVGEFGPDNIRQGRGIYRYSNGDVYYGNWHEEKFHG